MLYWKSVFRKSRHIEYKAVEVVCQIVNIAMEDNPL
jgi:hypothetical protein